MMNLFGSTEDTKKKCCGLTVAGTKEKRNGEKKKLCRKLEWATTHFHSMLGHNTANCIVTQLGWAHSRGATIRPAQRHETAMTRPR